MPQFFVLPGAKLNEKIEIQKYTQAELKRCLVMGFVESDAYIKLLRQDISVNRENLDKLKAERHKRLPG